jgi:hypothetical protein
VSDAVQGVIRVILYTQGDEWRPINYFYFMSDFVFLFKSVLNSHYPTQLRVFISKEFEQKNVLCGDGFMDFMHRPKSKILKIKN